MLGDDCDEELGWTVTVVTIVNNSCWLDLLPAIMNVLKEVLLGSWIRLG